MMSLKGRGLLHGMLIIELVFVSHEFGHCTTGPTEQPIQCSQFFEGPDCKQGILQ